MAYLEFLKANGVDSPCRHLGDVDYQDVLNQQEVFGEEINLFTNKEMQKEVIVIFFFPAYSDAKMEEAYAVRFYYIYIYIYIFVRVSRSFGDIVWERFVNGGE